jgi:ribosomal protein S18 acetylase RimI-like enzyme
METAFRPAARDDAEVLARMVNMAGEGMPLHLWTAMAARGQDPWEVGRQRALRETGGFSWRNATIAEAVGRIAGCLIGYRLADEPEPVDLASLPPMFQPLEELEQMAAGTWYVNVLAVEPELRGRGIGAALLGLAEQRASETGAAGTSVIVSDGNAGARRLYERAGYRERTQLPMAKDGWDNPGRNWVLLVRTA